MESFIESDLADKATKKFYNRIRSYLDDLALLPDDAPYPVSNRLSDIREEDKYGLITKNQIQILLEAYDKQPDRPLQCNQFEAGNLAKLLFSKASFHNPSSSNYLIEDLKINDVARSSFLGDHSTYAICESNSLAHLRKCQRKMFIIERVRRILRAIDDILKTQPVLSEEIEDEIEELIRSGKDNNDVKVVIGRRWLVRRQYDKAIEELRLALNYGCTFTEVARQTLSAALFEKGRIFYSGNDLERASDYFNESLSNNPENSSAKFHLELVQARILTSQRRFGSDTNKSYNRRR